MSVRSARRLLFLLLALTLPAPMLGPFGGLVPPVRYLILASAAGAVAWAEGAAGPVPWIVLFFAAHAGVYLTGVWLLAWGAARPLAALAPATRRSVVLGACGALLLLALCLDLYRTPFGRAARANLLGVLS